MNAKQQQGNRNEKVNGGEKDEEGREPGKRQCMGGAKTEDLLMVPSMLCLFPVFCLLLLAFLSRTHQRVIITSCPLTIAVSESGSHSLKNLTWAAMLRLRLTKEGNKC